MILTLFLATTTVLTVYASSCYKTSGSYVYFTYCSGYCSGSYGHETCDYSYYYYYYDGFYYSISSATIAGIVIGSLFGLAVLIAIIVVIVKTVTKSTGSHGRIVQPTITSGDATTIAYSTPTASYGQPVYYNTGNNMNAEQQNPQSYPPVYPPTSGYPSLSPQNATNPPPYYSTSYGGLTPTDTKTTHI